MAVTPERARSGEMRLFETAIGTRDATIGD
jgi:hypothetical protein